MLVCRTTSYHLVLLTCMAFSVFCELPHFVVPLLLRLFNLANQRHLLLQPPLTFRLVFLCTQLHTQGGFSFILNDADIMWKPSLRTSLSTVINSLQEGCNIVALTQTASGIIKHLVSTCRLSWAWAASCWATVRSSDGPSVWQFELFPRFCCSKIPLSFSTSERRRQWRPTFNELYTQRRKEVQPTDVSTPVNRTETWNNVGSGFYLVFLFTWYSLVCLLTWLQLSM